MGHYLVGSTLPFIEPGEQWRRGERVNVAKPKMAACSWKGGEQNSVNTAECFPQTECEGEYKRVRWAA